jgi:hypothetical protein
MPRIRTIKPGFWSDAGVVSLSHEARLLLIGLISMADDEGRFVATPAAIRGYVYPFDDVTDVSVRKRRDEIAKVGIVYVYSADGLELGQLPNFLRHQRVNRPTPSVIPPPPS